MRKLLSILVLVMTVGCATTSGWTKESRDEAMVSCSAALTISGYPVEITTIYCPCMTEKMQEDIPAFTDESVNAWFDSGSAGIAKAYCDALTEEKLKLQAK